MTAHRVARARTCEWPGLLKARCNLPCVAPYRLGGADYIYYTLDLRRPNRARLQRPSQLEPQPSAVLQRTARGETTLPFPSQPFRPAGPTGAIARAWHVPSLGWPAVFVIDGDRRIRHTLYGVSAIKERPGPAVAALLQTRDPCPTRGH